MSGYSDWPMRMLARRFGASYTVHEVFLDRFVDQLRDKEAIARHFTVVPDERPVAGQLMGSSIDRFRAATDRLIRAGFDVIDINFGCPIRTALGGCRGGYHLSQPEVALEIVWHVIDVAAGRAPVTVKMRRGMDDSAASERDFFAILHGAFEAGVAGVTVHGRTVAQRYTGASSWPFLKRVKSAAGEGIVLGSGDLFTAQDAQRMLAQTGIDGVAIARGALGNPWIYEDCLAGRPSRAPSLEAQHEVLVMHRLLCIERFGEARAVRPMRRFAVKCAAHHPRHAALRRAFGQARTLAGWDDVLAEFFSHVSLSAPE